ncbi:MAG: dihydroorotate dehydrogenase [Oscillospiraceae bacterium]|jgi:dihydroorotate dehydrogenase (NAD+) catalytic subunit|nr:dihydroorotate dehydrogenase [Oscillospiraceae bacterium]
MADMRVCIADVYMKNPVITASGTFGFGREYNEIYPIGCLGGISCKGTTLNEKSGNEPPRIIETHSGMLNSVGLQNPGVDHFLKEDLPWLKSQDVAVILNVAGSTVEEYCKIAQKVSDSDIDIIELNISCPNVKEGGVAFGTSANSVESITQQVKMHTKKPVMVKLSPNVTDIAEMARAAQSGGADAISLINTITGMRIDINTKRPFLKNNIGGLSGRAVFPVALRMVWQAANAVSVPVVGMGGIATAQDAIEMMLAGASAVQVGTANFTDAYAPVKIIQGIEKYLDDNGVCDVNDIVGQVKIW